MLIPLLVLLDLPVLSFPPVDVAAREVLQSSSVTYAAWALAMSYCTRRKDPDQQQMLFLSPLVLQLLSMADRRLMRIIQRTLATTGRPALLCHSSMKMHVRNHIRESTRTIRGRGHLLDG